MDVVTILSDLVRINSVNPEWGGPGEGEVADYVAGFFNKRSFEVTTEEVLPGRPNIIIKIPGTNPDLRLVLEAHMDTVSTTGMEIDPFEPTVIDGKLYGRGSVDIKAGLAAMMAACVEVEKPACEVWLAAVIDEEHAYRGVLSLIDSLKESADAAVVAEPTGNRIVRANKGVLRWRIRTNGVAAHSAMPEKGKNAIYEMARVITRLEQESKTLSQKTHPLIGSATHSVGTITGGIQVNIVPESCEIAIDRRLLPGENADQVLQNYQSILTDFDIEMLQPDLVDEAMETPAESHIVRHSQTVLDEFGGDSEPIGVPYGCDVTKLSRAGIPGIIFGPGSIEQAHAAVEYVDINQVKFASRFYRRLIENFR